MIHTCVKRKKWSSTGTLLSPYSVDSGRIVNHPHLCKRKEWVTHWDSCCLHAVDWGMIVAFIHSCGLGGEWCHHNWKRDHHYHVACPSQHFTLSMSLSTHHFQYVTLSTSLSICHSQHATLNTAPPTRHPQHVTLSMSLKVPNHEDPQRADHTQLSCPTITDAKSIWLNKIEFSFLFVGKWMDRPTICPVHVKTLAFLYFTELHQVHTTEVKLVHIDILSFSCVPVGATDALSWLSMMGKIGSAWELMQMFKTENKKKHGHCAVYWLCLCW